MFGVQLAYCYANSLNLRHMSYGSGGRPFWPYTPPSSQSEACSIYVRFFLAPVTTEVRRGILRDLVTSRIMTDMKTYRYYDLILAFFASILLISNLSATKLIQIGPFTLDGGAVLFPLIYIFGDILTEVYGYKYARRAIWTGFSVMLLAIGAFTIVRYLPGAAEYADQAAFEAVLGFFPRIVLASLVAYLVGSFVNSYILAKLKVKTAGKKLWLRLVSSTLAGELLDTVVFALIAFGGILTGADMLFFILVGWLFKTLVEIVFLPLTYRVIAAMKKAEGVDEFDKKTNFTPFSLGVK